MQYLVESRLAKAMGRAMIAVVTQVSLPSSRPVSSFQPSDYPLFESDRPSTPLPSISLDGTRTLYLNNGADPMIYGVGCPLSQLLTLLQMTYHHYPMNNNEPEMDAEAAELL